jgi:hypothetical protein
VGNKEEKAMVIFKENKIFFLIVHPDEVFQQTLQLTPPKTSSRISLRILMGTNKAISRQKKRQCQ